MCDASWKEGEGGGVPEDQSLALHRVEKKQTLLRHTGQRASDYRILLIQAKSALQTHKYSRQTEAPRTLHQQ
jgi:hypothetical protein